MHGRWSLGGSSDRIHFSSSRRRQGPRRAPSATPRQSQTGTRVLAAFVHESYGSIGGFRSQDHTQLLVFFLRGRDTGPTKAYREILALSCKFQWPSARLRWGDCLCYVFYDAAARQWFKDDLLPGRQGQSQKIDGVVAHALYLIDFGFAKQFHIHENQTRTSCLKRRGMTGTPLLRPPTHRWA